MPSKYPIIVAAFAFFALPLFSIATPYIVFRFFHVRDLPIGSGDNHVHDSLQSVLQTALAGLRFPFAADVPVAHTGLTRAGSPIHEVAFCQRDFYAQIVRFTPSASIYTTLSIFRHAADTALALDDFIMLLEDGELELFGVGDVLLLAHISEASHSARDAVVRVIVHVELAVARAAFIQKTVLAALTVMEQFDVVGIYTGSSVPPYSSRIEAITSEAVSNSSRYILAELEVAIATTLDLLSALTKFNRDGRSQRACARPALAVNDSCVDIAPLFDSVASAQSILALLTTLKDVLKGGVDGSWREQTLGVSGCNFAVSLMLTKAMGKALDGMFLDVAEARQTVQTG